MRAFGHISRETDPHVNLAVEECLMSGGVPCLYLWQNAPSVIVGRNQNAYTECDMGYLRKANIVLARRNTGGGAVYHDLGNINFSIIMPRALHDVPRSTAMVVRALRSLGVAAEASGRNDILLDGLKISGNAYYSNARVGLHHGTILFRLDAETMARALTVSPEKTSKHGIASVRARVGDLASSYPHLTIADIHAALEQAFCEEYGVRGFEAPSIPSSDLEPLIAKYSSPSWILGRINEYDVSREAHFAWGSARLSVLFAGTTPVSCEITSDSLDADTIDELRHALNSHGGAPAAHNAIVDDILNVYREVIAQGDSHDS